MYRIYKEKAPTASAGYHSLLAVQDSQDTSSLPFDPSLQAKSQEPGFHRERSLSFHLYTLFLFTKSDFKTVIFPQSIFAIAVALSGAAVSPRPYSGTYISAVLLRVPHMVAWIWIHLLVENLANPEAAPIGRRGRTQQALAPPPVGTAVTGRGAGDLTGWSAHRGCSQLLV